MSGRSPSPISGSVPVRLPEPRLGLGSQSRGVAKISRPIGNAKGRRTKSWIIGSIMLATTAFALIDLFLLVTSIQL